MSTPSPLPSNVRVRLAANVEKRIKLAAKDAFDTEILGFFLGHQISDTLFEIVDVYFPPSQRSVATPFTTGWDDEWLHEARDTGREDGLVVLGHIHSHCYDQPGADRAPSESDWDHISGLRTREFPFFAICTVTKTRRGKQARIRFWPKLPRVTMELV